MEKLSKKKEYKLPVLFSNQIVEGILSNDSLSIENYKYGDIVVDLLIYIKSNYEKIAIDYKDVESNETITLINDNCTEINIENFLNIYSVLSMFDEHEIVSVCYEDKNSFAEVICKKSKLIEISNIKNIDNYTYYKSHLYIEDKLVEIKEERVYPTEIKTITFDFETKDINADSIPCIQKINKNDIEYTFKDCNGKTIIIKEQKCKYYNGYYSIDIEKFKNDISYYIIDKEYIKLAEELKYNDIEEILDDKHLYLVYSNILNEYDLFRYYEFKYKGYSISDINRIILTIGDITRTEYQVLENIYNFNELEKGIFKFKKVILYKSYNFIIEEDRGRIRLYSHRNENKPLLLYEFDISHNTKYIYEYNNYELKYEYEFSKDRFYLIKIYNKNSSTTKLRLKSNSIPNHIKSILDKYEYIIKNIKDNFNK